MRERGIYPQDCPRTVRSRRNRCGNTELACSSKYHGAKTAYWAVGRQCGTWGSLERYIVFNGQRLSALVPGFRTADVIYAVSCCPWDHGLLHPLSVPVC